jgi:hypothetical protein
MLTNLIESQVRQNVDCSNENVISIRQIAQYFSLIADSVANSNSGA